MKEADWGILLPRIRSARRVKITEGNSTRPPTAKLMYKSPANKKKWFLFLFFGMPRLTLPHPTGRRLLIWSGIMVSISQIYPDLNVPNYSLYTKHLFKLICLLVSTGYRDQIFFVCFLVCLTSPYLTPTLPKLTSFHVT